MKTLFTLLCIICCSFQLVGQGRFFHDYDFKNVNVYRLDKAIFTECPDRHRMKYPMNNILKEKDFSALPELRKLRDKVYDHLFTGTYSSEEIYDRDDQGRFTYLIESIILELEFLEAGGKETELKNHFLNEIRNILKEQKRFINPEFYGLNRQKFSINEISNMIEKEETEDMRWVAISFLNKTEKQNAEKPVLEILDKFKNTKTYTWLLQFLAQNGGIKSLEKLEEIRNTASLDVQLQLINLIQIMKKNHKHKIPSERIDNSPLMGSFKDSIVAQQRKFYAKDYPKPKSFTKRFFHPFSSSTTYRRTDCGLYFGKFSTEVLIDSFQNSTNGIAVEKSSLLIGDRHIDQPLKLTEEQKLIFEKRIIQLYEGTKLKGRYFNNHDMSIGLGELSVPALLKLLSSENDKVISRASMALRKIRTPKAVELLYEHGMKSEDNRMTQFMAMSLKNWQNPTQEPKRFRFYRNEEESKAFYETYIKDKVAKLEELVAERKE